MRTYDKLIATIPDRRSPGRAPLHAPIRMRLGSGIDTSSRRR
jgi:hypothetical protein